MTGPRDHDHDDYLWDGSGKPDPEVERLERLLRPLRHERPLALDEAPALAPRAPLRTTRRRRVVWVAVSAAMAATLLIVGAAFLALEPAPPAAPGPRAPVVAKGGVVEPATPPASVPSWPVTMLASAASCSGEAPPPSCAGDATAPGESRLAEGSWLETGADSRAKLQVADIGFVELEASTRVRLVRTKKDEHRLELARGTLHATVSAVPRIFIVDTPAAEAIDLGCAYTLSADPSGNGRLSVRTGEVALVRGGREAWVPADASCELRAGVGPGTPYDDRAGAALRAALTRFDFGPAEGARGALDAILASATKRDALSLWHVAQRAPTAERERVLKRLIALAPPPPLVDRAALRRLDRAAFELYKSALREE